MGRKSIRMELLRGEQALLTLVLIRKMGTMRPTFFHSSPSPLKPMTAISTIRVTPIILKKTIVWTRPAPRQYGPV